MNVLELLNQWPWGAVDWLVIGLGVSLAYIVFGIAGFGTALVAGPILILFMPLSKIVPLSVLLISSRRSAICCPRDGMWRSQNCSDCSRAWRWAARWGLFSC
jgi:hypothetical protein